MKRNFQVNFLQSKEEGAEKSTFEPFHCRGGQNLQSRVGKNSNIYGFKLVYQNSRGGQLPTLDILELRLCSPFIKSHT